MHSKIEKQSIECGNCDAEFEFEDYDVYWSSNPHLEEVIICPFCDEEIKYNEKNT